MDRWMSPFSFFSLLSDAEKPSTTYTSPTARHTVLPAGKNDTYRRNVAVCGSDCRATERETKHRPLIDTQLVLCMEVSHRVGVWVMTDNFSIYIQTQRDTWPHTHTHTHTNTHAYSVVFHFHLMATILFYGWKMRGMWLHEHVILVPFKSAVPRGKHSVHKKTSRKSQSDQFPYCPPSSSFNFLPLKAWHLVIGREVTWGLVYFWCGDGRRGRLVSQSHRFVILLTFQITNAVTHTVLKNNHAQIGLRFSFFFLGPVPLYRTCLNLNRPATLSPSLSAQFCLLTPAPQP